MQSRKASAFEATTGTVAGLFISWLITIFVLPWWGFEPSVGQALEITAVYTLASLLRGYVVRRVFNYAR